MLARYSALTGVGLGTYKRTQDPRPVLPWEDLPRAYCPTCGHQATYRISDGVACDDHWQEIRERLLDERGGVSVRPLRITWRDWIVCLVRRALFSVVRSRR